MKTTLIIALLALPLTGCHDQLLPPDVDGSGHPHKRITYTMYASSSGFSSPATRVGQADEENITGNMWVFVFDTSTPDTLFLEAVEATDRDNTAGNIIRCTVSLRERNHSVLLFIVANTPTHYFDPVSDSPVAIDDSASWGLTQSSTLAYALARLHTVPLSVPQPHVPYTPNGKIPLSGQLYLDKLGSSTSLGTEAAPLVLQRIVARIVVQKAFDATLPNPPFLLKGASAFRVPRNAGLFARNKNNGGNLTDYLYPGPTFPDSTIIGISPAVDDSTTANPLYVYPIDEPDERNQPCIVIQARFSTDAADTYYKLVPTTPRRRLERNTNYRFVLRNCTGRGYATLREALDGPPSNVISYTMDVTDLSSYDLIDNGSYYLGFSNSEYLLLATGEVNGAVVTTVSYKQTNGVGDTIIVDNPVGGIPTVVSSPFSGLGDTSKELTMNFPSSFVSCFVTVGYGNLQKRIAIAKEPDLNYAASVDNRFANDEYVYGAIYFPSAGTKWIGLSTDPNPSIEGTDALENRDRGGFFLKLKSNVGGTDPDAGVPRNAVMYLSRRNDKGRLKVYMQQAFFN